MNSYHTHKSCNEKLRLRKAIRVVMLPMVLLPALGTAIAFSGLFGPSEDGFADKLTIPHNIAVSEPIEEHRELWEQDSGPSPKDTFQRRLMKALKTPATKDSNVTAKVSSLAHLAKYHPDILNHYLACTPYWRVFEEHGSRFATRRWIVGPHWHYDLHGYYSDFQKGYQVRVTIGLSGKPWARTDRDSTQMSLGETKKVDVIEGNSLSESHCVVNAPDLVVEVFEESKGTERRLTKAAFAYLEDEFGKLNNDPTWATIQHSIPHIASDPSKPTIKLWRSFQPGIYEAEVWANPKEPGMIYLKAFEVTHKTPLSAASLQEYSNERIGWSNNPKQLFVSSTRITISEGDWGKPYAARFEVWFKPDSGKPERKLMEKVFKIEGWQR